ncbi:hypothetical protein [Allohahella marinimesophila]|uniref:Uncharacterized protein n=1 Tax=Allohahella marinimesophila TaxID=1054972 RepID=A0ABP7PKE1_9GAMM
MNILREEYDFSKGERSKFYTMPRNILPIHLNTQVLDYFAVTAEGVKPNTMVDGLRRQVTALIEGVK